MNDNVDQIVSTSLLQVSGEEDEIVDKEAKRIKLRLVEKASSSIRSFTSSSSSLLSNHTYLTCKICLNKFPSSVFDSPLNSSTSNNLHQIDSCKCKFCINCLKLYIVQCIENYNVSPIHCPDANCSLKGRLSQLEVELILNSTETIVYDFNENLRDNNNNNNQIKEINVNDFYARYLRICQNIEILKDKSKIYCPSPNCQNICNLQKSEFAPTKRVKCDKCDLEFCIRCGKKWPAECVELNLGVNEEAEEVSATSILIEKSNSLMFAVCECEQTRKKSLGNLANIKRCPECSVLIERAEGCAQIMCKMCRHTFCFYCLTSLDNDFLLKHYTKNGPCKGKLGHSKLSLLMHRLSVVGIFTGSIFLIIILSPFILASLPFLIFSEKCRKVCYKFASKFG